MNIKEAKKIAIPSILEMMELQRVQRGSKVFYSSPFSSDSNPSLLWNQHDNTFYDFSTGKWGDVIQLIRELKDCSFTDALKTLEGFYSSGEVIEFTPKENYLKKDKNDFRMDSYITGEPDEIKAIDNYAKKRRISRGYYPCFFYEPYQGSYRRVLALGFPHYNYDLMLSGVKMRRIDGNEPRFNARGRLGLHILSFPFFENAYKHHLYIVESETSANSLAEYMVSQKMSGIVISCGSNTSAPKEIPSIILSKLDIEPSEVKVIVDYDGDEKKYQRVLKLYEHLGAKSVRILLEKKEDINSLYVKGKIGIISNLI